MSNSLVLANNFFYFYIQARNPEPLTNTGSGIYINKYFYKYTAYELYEGN